MKRKMVVAMIALLWGGQAWAVCTVSVTPSTPTSRFVVNANGTVTDKKTKLMWMQCSEGQFGASCTGGTIKIYTWPKALSLVQTTNAGGFAGYNDWRLPNLKELSSIVEYQCVSPAVNATVFPTTGGKGGRVMTYWTSSVDVSRGGNVWIVDFNLGNLMSKKELNTNFVRLVRGGQ